MSKVSLQSVTIVHHLTCAYLCCPGALDTNVPTDAPPQLDVRVTRRTLTFPGHRRIEAQLQVWYKHLQKPVTQHHSTAAKAVEFVWQERQFLGILIFAPRPSTEVDVLRWIELFQEAR